MLQGKPMSSGSDAPAVNIASILGDNTENNVVPARESFYNLDYPSKEELSSLQLDPTSRFFSRERPRTMDLPNMLPYKTETPRDQAKFLSHIVSHLYIAIKTLDLQGAISVSAKDLKLMRNSIANSSGSSSDDVELDASICAADDIDNLDFDYNAEYDEYDDDDDDDDDLGESDGGALGGSGDVHENAGADDGTGGDQDAEGLDEDGESTSQHKKSPKSAANVSVCTWTHELLVWLQMKYDMPLTLRASLVKVYYAICLSRGQHLNLKMYTKTFEVLTKSDNALLLKKSGLRLDWEPVYLDFLNLFSPLDPSAELFEKKDYKLLLRLASRAAHFFEPGALPLIYSKLGNRLTLTNASLVVSTMALLPLNFTTTQENPQDNPQDIRHYVASFFYVWSKLNKFPGLDTQITSRLGLIAMSALTEINNNNKLRSAENVKLTNFGIFTEAQMKSTVNTLLNSLSIRIEKYSSLKAKYFHGYSSIIVFSLTADSEKIMGYLRTLLNAIHSYVHPSNTGDWSRPISKLILSLIYQYHKRFGSETEPYGTLYHLPPQYKLSSEVTDEFITLMLPMIKIGLQSKKLSAVESYVTSLRLLAHLNPAKVLEYFVLDIYESLEGVISTHRVTVAFRSIESLMRYFASTPVYRVHLIRLLSISLPGIDSNDLEKTINTLDVFASAANFIPFNDLSEGEDGDASFAIQFTSEHLEYLQRKLYSAESSSETFEVSPELELQALKSCTSAFKSIFKTLSERIFTLMENIPDPSKSDGVEKDFATTLPKLLYVLFESLSDEIFNIFRHDFFEFIFNNTIHTLAGVAAEICGGLIKRDPKAFGKYLSIFNDKIREEITENGAGVARTGDDIVPRDQTLFWNLVILNECIGNAGSYLLKESTELIELSYFLMDTVKGPAVFASTYLVNQVLQSVTKIRLLENRLIAPSYEKKHGIDEKCWGAFQFDEARFSKENTDFSWFMPDEKDIKFAVEFFNGHVTRCLSSIHKLIKDYNGKENDSDRHDDTSIEVGDEIRMNILYLAYSLSGASYLFDPSFNEDILKTSSQLRTRLLRKASRNEDLNVDESINGEFEDNLTNKLQQIVDDLQDDISLDNSQENVPLEAPQLVSISEAVPMEIDSDISEVHKTIIEDSARATPTIGDIDMSSMNPSITFRERKLYTSNYYFGDDAEHRKSNEIYLKLHKTRHLIGKSLHVICKFLSTHFLDNTKLFKQFLYVVNIWFSDFGRERILDSSHAKIHFSYISTIQHINRIRKPYTRIAIGSRLECYHSLRVALHATSRAQTNLEKTLLEDVVRLSVSTYMAIAKPAQALLVDAMKRVSGSYGVIIKTSLRYLFKALEEQNVKKVECGLSIFSLKKVKSKIRNDYSNLPKYLNLLYKCLQVDRIEVQKLAQQLFEDVYNNIGSPSSVCIIDFEYIDSIKPPDGQVESEIKLVQMAKDRKRKQYSEKWLKIEELIVMNEQNNSYWKTTSINLHLLINLQEDIEAPTNPAVFEILGKEASSDHPVNSRLALKGITNLMNKLNYLQNVNYNLRDVYDLKFVPKDHKIIDTSPKNGKSYYDSWRQELGNVSNPSYYIDSKASYGWLFWDKEMTAVSNESNFHFRLSPRDQEALKGFCKFINKDWFMNIISLWVTDNEATSAFQGTDVFVTAIILMLVSNGYIEGYTFEDLLKSIEKIYVADDKGSHIVCCELISGILVGSKYTNPEYFDRRDEFISDFLGKVLENDLSPDNRAVWNIFAWWTPSHIDCRRFPRVMKVITNFSIDMNSDSALREATRISYVRSFVASVTWSIPDPDPLIKFCIDNVNHSYEAIRTQIGALLGVLSFPYYGESVADAETFVINCNRQTDLILYDSTIRGDKPISLLPELFERVESWRLQVESLTPQEISKSNYIYASTTILTWLGQELNSSLGVLLQDFVDKHIIPFLLKLINMKDVCQLGNIDPITVFKKVSQIPYAPRYLERIVSMLEYYSGQDLNVVQTVILGEFTETFYFKNLISLEVTQRQKIVELTNKLVYHKNVEIRESAASTLSGLIHSLSPEEVEKLVKQYTTLYTKDLDDVRKKYGSSKSKINVEDTVILHGATLGLGSLVHAFAFSSPPPAWVPQILTTLASKSTGFPGVIGKTAKETLGTFKKNRQDTWHIDSKVFTPDQIQDLEGVLWRSYFI